MSNETNEFWDIEPQGSHNDGTDFSSAAEISKPGSGGTKLLIQALVQNVRITFDGTTPTASKGFQLKAGDPPVLFPIGLNATVTVIEEAATADVQYQWFD